jgi:hypothetical protein
MGQELEAAKAAAAEPTLFDHSRNDDALGRLNVGEFDAK